MNIDRASMEQWLGTDNKLDEAIDILVDIINGDYKIKTFKNDVSSYFEPDDRGDIERWSVVYVEMKLILSTDITQSL